mgnify:CR=1 FL=1
MPGRAGRGHRRQSQPVDEERRGRDRGLGSDGRPRRGRSRDEAGVRGRVAHAQQQRLQAVGHARRRRGAQGGEQAALLVDGIPAVCADDHVPIPRRQRRPREPAIDVGADLVAEVSGHHAPARAAGRSRGEVVDLAGLFYLTGSGPADVRRKLLGLWFAQIAVAGGSVAVVQPPFGVMAPVWGIGLLSVWGARHGALIVLANLLLLLGFFGGAIRSRTGLDGFAIRCITDLLSRQFFLTKKGSLGFPFSGIWSGKRVSNSRPQPWQGCALPTELFPQI